MHVGLFSYGLRKNRLKCVTRRKASRKDRIIDVWKTFKRIFSSRNSRSKMTNAICFLCPKCVPSTSKNAESRCGSGSQKLTCDPAGTRTQGPYIKSVLLYQLSYEINRKRECKNNMLSHCTQILKVFNHLLMHD